MMNKQFLNTTTRNVHWLVRTHEADELDMKPPFQRNPVWVHRQKSFLVDTILSGFPIPEIYMQDIVDDEGNAKYIVVDGQQRLRAVLEYVANEFPIDPKDSPSWGDMYFDDLKLEDRKRIRQYDFIVRQLPEMDDSQIREIFQRLNKNVSALNKQELRQATYWGPFINLMNDISDWDEWAQFSLFSANDIRRMLDVEFISELTIAELNGHQNKKAKLDHYYQIYEEAFEHSSIVKRLFRDVLGELENVLPEVSRTRWSNKTNFYTLFLVFAKNRSSLPLSSNVRKKVTSVLLKFGEGIDQFVRSDDVDKPKLPKHIRDYGTGIRASTDLGSRKRRFSSLETQLAKWL
jgi:hypothetical protein